ncbi:unnamed protein product [Rodentolepis nana]|uniref:Uncharacterized protein n=1 Tax=Rodentolepis nana TaxID=102285 RepID=A0A0R3TX28_RODNA|nr:unnamed protein product [Rodentolepis nana]
MQSLLVVSSPTTSSKKKRRRRAKRKNAQQQQQQQQDQIADENTQIIGDEIVPAISEPRNPQDDNPPSKSTSISYEDNIEGGLKGSEGSPEKQNVKKKRKRRRRNRKSVSRNESDSGISNPSISDYSGPNEELFMSINNLFVKLSDELPTIDKAIQSLDLTKKKEIDHLTWHLEIAKTKSAKSKKSLVERCNERLNAWYCFMILLRYYLSYYGSQSSKALLSLSIC